MRRISVVQRRARAGDEVLFRRSSVRKRRFTYKEVLAILQQPRPDDPIEQMLHQAHELAQNIRRARFEPVRWSWIFPKRKSASMSTGACSLIEKIENDVSHQLIEEYMLLANEAVAARLMALHRPAIYRVHEPPARDAPARNIARTF